MLLPAQDMPGMNQGSLDLALAVGPPPTHSALCPLLLPALCCYREGIPSRLVPASSPYTQQCVYGELRE